MTSNITPLNDGWAVSSLREIAAKPELSKPLTAMVPGCVHLDLMAARVIADPYQDLNEITNDWVGREAWKYSCKFDWKSGDGNADLVFEGLDTVATVWLNGIELGKTFNMHRTYRFAVADRLQDGENELTVVFGSAHEYGKELEAHYGYRPNNYPGGGNLMRKMACNFGWDWGPTLITAGIWKPVSLETWADARLKSVRPSVGLKGADGHVRLDVDLERDDPDAEYTLLAEVASVEVSAKISAGQTSISLDIIVPEPQLWWPHGLGNQPLYDLSVTLKDKKNTLDSWGKKVGFRSVRLDTTKDKIGSAFAFIINDVPVYICGANWIPDDCFPSRVTADRYIKRIDQAKGANINMLRVWGGGIFETDEFYEACDAAGMLVWQDFLFACACYPEEEPHWSEVEAEVRDNVTRLMHHSALIMWNGNNENIWGFYDWGWEPALKGKTWGLGYYTDLLPKICAELDPTTPYFAGSPYSGEGIHPNVDEHGCKHVWDVWNDVGYEKYRDYIPRFCSEFGWQAPPTWATLEGAVNDDPITPTSPGVFHHQKATIGNDKLLRGLKGHLPEPQNTDDWHYVTQLNQARAIAFAVEHFRSHRPTNMGAIVWQLNDCWPVTSWAAIDSGERLKPLWYAMRRVFAQHLLTIQPRGDGLSVIAVNEWTLPWRGAIKARRMNLQGDVLAEYDFWRLVCDRLDAAAHELPADIVTPDDPANEFIVVEMLEKDALWFFNEDIKLNLEKAEFDLTVSQGDADEWHVDIRAKTLLRDVCIFADRIHPDASIDEMIVTILPDETQRFTITSPVEIDAGQVRTALRCVNNLG